MMKKTGLVTLPFQLSSAEVDASDELLLDVMPCIHDYIQQIMVHKIDSQQGLLMMLSLTLCIRQTTPQHTGTKSEIASKVKTLQLR